MRVIAPAEAATAGSDPSLAQRERATLRLDAAAHAAPSPAAAAQRHQLERELDRVQDTLNQEQASFGRQLAWQTLAQGLLLNAYLIVLVLGWSAPLPAKRWLLAALAIFAGVTTILAYIAQRGNQDALLSLRTVRRELEATLQHDFGRPPLFAPRSVVTRCMASLSAALLPLLFIIGWSLLTIYTLAAPLAAHDGASTATATAAAGPRRALPAVVGPRPPTATAAAGEAAQAATADAAAGGEGAPPRRTGLKW